MIPFRKSSNIQLAFPYARVGQVPRETIASAIKKESSYLPNGVRQGIVETGTAV